MTATAKTKTRVFLAHPKDADPEKLWWWGSQINQWLVEAGYEVEVILGKQDYDQHFASEGNFDAWARSVPTRRDTFTGEKMYDSIFVPGFLVGKATAAIVESALKVKTPVFSLDDLMGDVVFHHITQIDEVDGRDYRTGWQLLTD